MTAGFVNVLKPPGLTSHAVVGWVRRLLKERRVGHAGTLDPAACGVLVLALGQATRLIGYLEGTKTYRGEITFGVETTTQDAEGAVVRESSAPITAADVERVLPRFTGEITQVPPMVSAVHYQGRRLYELARAGVVVDRTPRRVHIKELRLLAFRPHPSHPCALVECRCSAGTYVRALAAEIGRALGTGAYLSFLLRTASGAFELAESWTLEELAAAVGQGREQSWLRAPDAGLGHLPAVTLTVKQCERFSHGNAFFCPAPSSLVPGQAVRVYGEGATFLGVGFLMQKEQAWLLRPAVVLPKEC